MTTAACVFRGMPAYRLTGGGYEAVIAPGYGANCISLRHLPSGGDFLRTPQDENALRSDPNVYGLPLLFPPNRIRDGRYTYMGHLYQFPINEPARHHHIHGVLSGLPFAREADAVFVYRADAARPYLAFPHAFTVRRAYRLDETGLCQTVTFVNDGDTAMPMGTGVHAAWNVPFLPGTDARDYRLAVPVARQWVYDRQTIIPTGETLTRSPLLDALRDGALCPEGQPLSLLLECGEGAIALSCPGGAFLCERDGGYPFVMLWNGTGSQRFVCPEPQSWLVDAPNLPLPASETGFSALAPGEERSYRLRYRFVAAQA